MEKEHTFIIAIVAILAVVGFVSVVFTMGPIFKTGTTNLVGNALAQSCSDSDGGQAFEIKGTTILGPINIATDPSMATGYAAIAPNPTPITPITQIDSCYLSNPSTQSWNPITACYGVNCYLKEYFCSKDLKTKLPNIMSINFPFGLLSVDGSDGACVDGVLQKKFFDLEVVQISAPSSAYANQEVEITILVSNKGNIGGYIQGSSESICLNDTNGTSCGGISESCGSILGGIPCGTYIGPKGNTSFIIRRIIGTTPGNYIITIGKTGQGYYNGNIYTDINPLNNQNKAYVYVMNNK